MVCFKELFSYDMIAMQLKCKLPRNIIGHIGPIFYLFFSVYDLYTVNVYAKQLSENSFELLS